MDYSKTAIKDASVKQLYPGTYQLVYKDKAGKWADYLFTSISSAGLIRIVVGALDVMPTEERRELLKEILCKAGIIPMPVYMAKDIVTVIESCSTFDCSSLKKKIVKVMECQHTSLPN